VDYCPHDDRVLAGIGAGISAGVVEGRRGGIEARWGSISGVQCEVYLPLEEAEEVMGAGIWLRLTTGWEMRGVEETNEEREEGGEECVKPLVDGKKMLVDLREGVR
jgi:hypothetical protein